MRVFSLRVKMLLSMLSHDNLAFGSWKSPMIKLAFSMAWDLRSTFNEVGNKTMGSLVDEITLACYTNGSQNVISGAHNLSNARFWEFVQYTCGTGFQFIFEDDESDKVQPRLGLFTLHFLDFDPIKLCNMFCCTCNYPKAAMGVIGKKLFVVRWNYSDVSSRDSVLFWEGRFLQLSALQTSFMHSGAPLT
jgi:hypothetical protein